MKTLKDKKKLRDIIKKDIEKHEDDLFNSTPIRSKHSKRMSIGSDDGELQSPVKPAKSNTQPAQVYPVDDDGAFRAKQKTSLCDDLANAFLSCREFRGRRNAQFGE